MTIAFGVLLTECICGTGSLLAAEPVEFSDHLLAGDLDYVFPV